jgi:uncharacterized protein (DUF488 family)
MQLFTIGFTKTSAENFFTRLKRAGVRRLLDVRLNNVSQLAGFAKKDDLAYFADALCGAEYKPMPKLAPTREMLDAYRKKNITWAEYEDMFRKLIKDREIERLNPDVFDGGCLLCSEDKPHHCHRRIVAEYLQSKWTDVDIVHL